MVKHTLKILQQILQAFQRDFRHLMDFIGLNVILILKSSKVFLSNLREDSFKTVTSFD